MKNAFGRACKFSALKSNTVLLNQLYDYNRLARNVAAHILYKRTGTRPPIPTQKTIDKLHGFDTSE